MFEKKIILTLFLFTLIAVQGISSEDQPYSPEAEAKRSSFLDKSQESFTKALLPDEAKAIKNAHSDNIERLNVSLRIIDLQISWVVQNLSHASTPSYKGIWVKRDFPVSKVPAVIERDFCQGALTSTGNKFDLAISGPGLFKLTDNQGQVIFRRWGSFKINADRYLVDLRGNLLIPKIQIPPNLEEDTFSVSDNGNVTVTNKQGKRIALGSFQLFEPLSPQNLQYNEECNCFQTGIKNADKTSALSKVSETTAVNQGFVEMSNVDPEEQRANLIVLLKHRTALIKALKLLQAPVVPKP